MEDGEKMKVGKQRGDWVYSEIKEKKGHTHNQKNKNDRLS